MRSATRPRTSEPPGVVEVTEAVGKGGKLPADVIEIERHDDNFLV